MFMTFSNVVDVMAGGIMLNDSLEEDGFTN